MYQGTTPTLELQLNEDLTDCTVYISIRDTKSRKVYTWNSNSDGFISMTCYEKLTIILFRLTQEQTLALNSAPLDIQVRFVDANGNAGITDVQRISNLEALYKEPIEHI